MNNRALSSWVDEMASHARPDRIVWCDGSGEENRRLVEGMLGEKTLHRLNEAKFPNCYLHRSHPSDVARTEHLTFICSDGKEEAGPNNNWMSPAEARERVWPLFGGAMKGRTMYVVPYVMGPLGSPHSKVGIEITDSPYVVASMRIMTRMGKAALEQLGESEDFVKGLHSLGDLSPERRFVLHFPKAREIWSVGSGYGGNALLGKKCFALRIASVQGRDEGWMAEHMLIVGVESPEGETAYVAAAFPSACGKTNLAMLVPPPSQKGWKVWTVGDDIAWMRPGPDGRLWAVNPEAGFFGVAPGTSKKTNPNALAALSRNSVFTNVAMTEDGCPWWEGLDGEVPERLTDWQGRPWKRGSPEKAAHPNSRFTAPASQCPSISPRWEDPQGVPISAFLFGGRRATTFPLVFQSFDWSHGVFAGAGTGSETTAAQSGAVGVVRRDPMAMLPFCGYNMADYFGHWLAMGRGLANPPGIFHVNWFRRGADGSFLWPGFGENLRVLRWVIERCRGKGEAVRTPIGWVPSEAGIDAEGLSMPSEAMRELLRVDRAEWKAEIADIRAFFAKFGARMPAEMLAQVDALERRLAGQ
ncbi:MAG TPA: phosphoenolpyruvate carboxykinase (GTP) [Planctomycetota bacterium]|jgi:phosphoenolpyruvate carboxykinase (GTP)|nr:phosphoenolpyruvate carboxykinase (GTP) [Planctomycetota bacterium]